MSKRAGMFLAALALALIFVFPVCLSASAAASDWSGDFQVAESGDGLTVTGTATYGRKIEYKDVTYLDNFEIVLDLSSPDPEFYGLILAPVSGAYITSIGAMSFLIRPNGDQYLVHVNTYNTVITNVLTVPAADDGIYTLKLNMDREANTIEVDVNGVKDVINSDLFNYKVMGRGVHVILGVNGGSGDAQQMDFSFGIKSIDVGAKPEGADDIYYGCYITEEDERIQRLYNTKNVE